MSAVTTSTMLNKSRPAAAPVGREWWPILLGTLALYLPTFYRLATGVWDTEAQAHGPIILALVLYLFWQQRAVLWQPARLRKPWAGGLMLALGLAAYVLGRSQTILVFEVGSLLPVLAGAVLLMRGTPGLRQLAYALGFSVFLVPLPGVLVDALTGPLKQLISVIAQTSLFALGYPIARSGVTLIIGPYQLLVADACSGLHSLFSLCALGIFYLHQTPTRSPLHAGLLLASILPIAFAANVLRVIVLILVTYYFGDAAGQGFIHGFASVFLFVAALALLFGLDGMLGKFRHLHLRQTPGAA
jgi:exosortase B